LLNCLLMSAKYRLPRGTKDFLPQEAYTATLLENKAREVFATYGYREVRLPSIENKGIFVRGLGGGSEVVEKQIFTIEGKDDLCLRPEATAQIVRSYIEHNLYNQRLVKLFYIGAMFRGERPQKGRLRQFHHIGAEAIGERHPGVDAEVVKLAYDLLRSFDVGNFTLEINSLGCPKDKESLRGKLKDKLKGKLHLLCGKCQHRFARNTLRLLDCKNPGCKDAVSSLGIGRSYLCKDCAEYYRAVLEILKDLSVNYRQVDSLVRGLDYYTHTVFEFTTSLLGSQNAVGAGGRYDELVEELGGPKKPSCGFALGLERILLLREKEELPCPRVFVAYTTAGLGKRAFLILDSLRGAGISSDMDFHPGSLKSQLRYGRKLRADFAVILGQDELENNSVILRDMKASSQEVVKIDNLINRLRVASSK